MNSLLRLHGNIHGNLVFAYCLINSIFSKFREKMPLAKQPSFYFPGSPSSSSDDISTPLVNKSELTFSSMQSGINRVSMFEVEKMLNHEKKKMRLEHEDQLFKLEK